MDHNTEITIVATDKNLFKTMYKELEEQLEKATVGEMLIFPLTTTPVKTVRASVSLKAKKMGIKWESRIEGNNLYINILEKNNFVSDINKVFDILDKYYELSTFSRSLRVYLKNRTENQ